MFDTYETSRIPANSPDHISAGRHWHAESECEVEREASGSLVFPGGGVDELFLLAV